jgi:hypothetical protein
LKHNLQQHFHATNQVSGYSFPDTFSTPKGATQTLTSSRLMLLPQLAQQIMKGLTVFTATDDQESPGETIRLLEGCIDMGLDRLTFTLVLHIKQV